MRNYKTLLVLLLSVLVSAICACVIPFMVLGTNGMVTPFWALWIIVWALVLLGSLIGVVAWFAFTFASYFWRKFYDRN